jgi:endonuclease YncB( thermonuclease family)
MKLARRHALAAPAVAVVLGAGTVLAATPAHAYDKDCGDFASQKSAQIFFLNNGGPLSDPHGLDSEGDGIACESNPAPYYYGTAPLGSGSTTSLPKPTVIKQKAVVTRVVDGDTIDVRLGSGKTRRVRLIGIDTPEVYGGVECGGKKASASMRRLTPPGTAVVLVSDPTQDKVDRYGRLLRYVMKSGRDMNRAQVNRGWATVYVYNDNPFKRVGGFRKSQRAATANGRGIWSLCR